MLTFFGIVTDVNQDEAIMAQEREIEREVGSFY